MSCSVGPNQVNNGLVFEFDMANKKSWAGGPATNYHYTSGLPGPWTVNGLITDVTGTADQGPLNAKTWKFEKTGTSSQWHGWESSYGTIWTGSAGDIWTTSFWYKTSAPAGLGGFSAGAFYLSDWSRAYNYTVLYSNLGIIADGQWHYCSVTTQFNEAYTNAIIADGPSWNYSGSAGVLYINGLQWTKAAYAPAPHTYISGTTANTQSIIDLTNNNTLIASNVAYNYDGSGFSFNGSNYIDVNSQSIISGTNPFTIESWTNLTSGSYGEIFGNYGTGYATGNLWWATAGLYINSSVYHTNYATTMAGVHHSAVTRDSSGNVRLYRDGVLVGTGILTASVPTNINYRIGADVNGALEGMNGNIYSVKVYNRVLSDTEIQQNFNASRGRFGI